MDFALEAEVFSICSHYGLQHTILSQVSLLLWQIIMHTKYLPTVMWQQNPC